MRPLEFETMCQSSSTFCFETQTDRDHALAALRSNADVAGTAAAGGEKIAASRPRPAALILAKKLYSPVRRVVREAGGLPNSLIGTVTVWPFR